MEEKHISQRPQKEIYVGENTCAQFIPIQIQTGILEVLLFSLFILYGQKTIRCRNWTSISVETWLQFTQPSTHHD